MRSNQQSANRPRTYVQSRSNTVHAEVLARTADMLSYVPMVMGRSPHSDLSQHVKKCLTALPWHAWGSRHGKVMARELDSLEGEEGGTHLNGAAEGDFAIPLAEVHVSHTQVGSLNEHREIHLCSTVCCLGPFPW